MANNYRSFFTCDGCGLAYSDYDDAALCCPAISEVHECMECKKRHKHYENAHDCCLATMVRCPCCKREVADGSVDFVAVSVAAHCRTCNPLFSHDEQAKIESVFSGMDYSPYSHIHGNDRDV